MFLESLDNSLITLGSSNMSKLVIFLFIIAGNYVGDIYSCSLRHYFNNHMIVKHLIGVVIMFVFVGSIENTINTMQKLGLSIIFYFWFLLIMRTNMKFTILIIFIIIILFILESHINDLKKDEEKNKQDILYYQRVMNFIFILNLIISFVGFFIFLYYTKTNIKDFNYYQFLKGSRDQKCFTPEYAKLFSNKPMDIPIKIKKRMNLKKNL